VKTQSALRRKLLNHPNYGKAFIQDFILKWRASCQGTACR